jgi:DNA-binding transcriptional regulator YiaG
MSFASALRSEIRRAVSSELTRALRPIDRKVSRLLSRRGSFAFNGRRGRRGGGLNRRAAARATAAAAGVTPRAVRQIRARLNMTRPQFARLAGVSTWTVFMWEHGKVAPSGPSIARLKRLEKQAARGGAARGRRAVPANGRRRRRGRRSA